METKPLAWKITLDAVNPRSPDFGRGVKVGDFLIVDIGGIIHLPNASDESNRRGIVQDSSGRILLADDDGTQRFMAHLKMGNHWHHLNIVLSDDAKTVSGDVKSLSPYRDAVQIMEDKDVKDHHGHGSAGIMTHDGTFHGVL